MKIQDIPRLLFDEFKEGPLIRVESNSGKVHIQTTRYLAKLRDSGEGEGVICWCTRDNCAHLIIYRSADPNKVVTSLENELVKITFGSWAHSPLGTEEDTVYTHTILENRWLEFPLAITVSKLFARIAELFEFLKQEKTKA